MLFDDIIIIFYTDISVNDCVVNFGQSYYFLRDNQLFHNYNEVHCTMLSNKTVLYLVFRVKHELLSYLNSDRLIFIIYLSMKY
jgi:hypothetical protein